MIPTITFVVAAANNNVIGNKGELPWKQAADMKHFKNMTWGFPVIMGRKSFDSLGSALPGRTNIIVTRQPGWNADDTIVVPSLEDALEQVRQLEVKEAMVIGGGEIFKMAMPKAQKIHLTRIDAEPGGDAFLPVINTTEWKMVNRQDYKADEKNQYDYSFQTWERI